MKTPTEMESVCSRILGVLEHDDLRTGTLVALSAMLSRVRGDLESHLTHWRSSGGDSSELRSAEDSLRTMTASLLWLQERAEVEPLMEVSQKLRLASLRGLRIASLLQYSPQGVEPSTARVELAARHSSSGLVPTV